MLDIKNCPGCGSNTSYTNATCPYCGYRFDNGTAEATASSVTATRHRCPKCDTPVSANRSVCPTCRTVLKTKRGFGTYLLIAGFILASVLLAVFVFHIPGTPSSPSNISHVPAVTVEPTVPSCNIAITGQKLPTGMIQLRLMAFTCGPGDVTKLRVLVNNKDGGELTYQLGSSGMFPGHKGSDHVAVVATFSSGYEKIVFDSTYA